MNTDAPPAPSRRSTKRTVILTLVTLAVLGIVGVLAVIGLGTYAFVSNVDIADSTPEEAQTSFEATRARFAGDEALIHLARENGDVQAEVRRRAEPSKVQPEALHVMVWDPGDERLVNVRIPLWLLRFADDGTVTFSEEERDLVGDLNLSVADIDHHGPGLVLDYQEGNRERVLLWAE